METIKIWFNNLKSFRWKMWIALCVLALIKLDIGQLKNKPIFRLITINNE